MHLQSMTPGDYDRALKRKGRNVTDSAGPSIKAVSRLRQVGTSSGGDSSLDKHINQKRKSS